METARLYQKVDMNTRREDDDEPLEVEDAPKPLSKLQILLLNISWYGFSTMFLVLSVVVVPAQIEAMVGSTHKGRYLGGMVACGAVLMFISGPLVGMASDRMVSKYGRRRPVILIGTLMLCIGLCGMAVTTPRVHVRHQMNATGDCVVDLVAQRCAAYQNKSVVPLPHTNQQDSLPQQGMSIPEKNVDVSLQEESMGNIGIYALFYLLVATSFTTATVPYNGLIADKSHSEQRGLSSGMMGFMILFGNISGASLGLFFVQLGVLGIYAVVISLMVICVLITVISVTEIPGKAIHEPIGIKKIFIGFWEPLKGHDFRWVFITRFLLQQGVSTVTGFLEYWLSDMVHLPNCWTPERSVAMMLVPLLGTAAIGSIICGVVSDRIGRRKPLVIMSAVLMFVVSTILTFIRGHDAYYIALILAFIFGAGFGCFQAVDFALVMDVLPDNKDKAKDIAVWHQALILPQALATPIGGFVLDLFESINCEIGLGYIMLFIITSVYFFLSAIFVTKITVR
jgi:MFS family permease